ncbi:MAG: hypothetical protein QME58_06600 [Bacteroidota bacterium]|nr:hypothetical protein [Bacteroidota bacterium]
MKPENRINLIKELQKIKQINSRTSYLGAWTGLIIFSYFLATLIVKPWDDFINQGFYWVPSLIILVFLAAFLQSFFLIIRYLIYKRLLIIFEALLDDN